MTFQNWFDAQCGVLGSLLISPNLAPNVISQMTDSDFSGKLVAVFQAARSLFMQSVPIDVISITDKLGSEYTPILAQLMEITPTAANYQTYIDLAKKQARAQQLRDIGQMMSMAESYEEIQNLFERAVVVNSQSQGLHAVTLHEAMIDFVQRMAIDSEPDYLPWPIRGMSKKLLTERGDFIIIGARPSVGKTAFALQCGGELGKKLKVGFFSTETTVKKLTDRHVANVCNVPLYDIKLRNWKNDRPRAIINYCDQESVKNGLEIIHAPESTVAEIRAYSVARQYDVVIIDYLQLVSGPERTPYDRVTAISKQLHNFAQATGTVIIALSQLNRTGADGVPDLTSLRESGQLEQDSDAIMFLYLEDEEIQNGPRILRCAKNKDGERFRVKLGFSGKHQRFMRWEDFQRLPDDVEVPFETVGGIL